MKRFANPLSITTATLVLAALVPHAAAQPGPRMHAEANEAVYVDQFGNKKYRMPPQPMRPDGTPQGKPVRPFTFVDTAYMVETSNGLMECASLWLDTCRPSTYGTGQLMTRWWIVLRNGIWYSCFGPARTDKCIAMVAYNGPKGDTSEANRWATPPRT